MSWNWKELEEAGAKAGTEWEFVAAGCQFRNGLAEARVKATKQMLEHMLTTAVNGGKPTLSYAELQTLLTKIANIINDRPIGVQGLTEDELVPLTVNQLLLGRTSSSPPPEVVPTGGNPRASRKYLEDLTQAWWKLWMQQAFPTLLPYSRFKDTKRHQNLQVNDVCLIRYETKVAATYRLCRVSKVLPSEGGVVRTVEVQLGSRKVSKRAQPVKHLVTAVQRLVLLVPADEGLQEAQDQQVDAQVNAVSRLKG